MVFFGLNVVMSISILVNNHPNIYKLWFFFVFFGLNFVMSISILVNNHPNITHVLHSFEIALSY